VSDGGDEIYVAFDVVAWQRHGFCSVPHPQMRNSSLECEALSRKGP
jgi:hypothetical protein